MTTTNTAQALENLNRCWLDLAAAHGHAVTAATQLSGARQQRGNELADKCADALAHCRRLSFVTEGDLRADQTTS